MPQEKIESIKENIMETDRLNDEEKSLSIQHIEEWIAEDEGFGLLQEKLIGISLYFEELFSEMGIK